VLRFGVVNPQKPLQKAAMGNVKPKQKFRKIKPTFECIDLSLPNFKILRSRQFAYEKLAENKHFEKSAILDF